jgi:hypothetical protein
LLPRKPALRLSLSQAYSTLRFKGTPPVPAPPSKKALEKWRKAGADPAEKPRTRFRLTAVFDRSQIAPLPEPAEPMPLDPPVAEITGDDLRPLLEPLVAFAETIGSTMTFEPVAGDAHGCYELQTRRIVIDSDMAPNAQVKTGLHELAHALVRHDPDVDDAELTYAEEELVVECVVFCRGRRRIAVARGPSMRDRCHRQRRLVSRRPAQRVLND